MFRTPPETVAAPLVPVVVRDDIKAAAALMTLPDMVIVVPSGLTHPICDVVAVVQLAAPAVTVRVELSPFRMPSVVFVPVASK
jgi:hypothetical protein